MEKLKVVKLSVIIPVYNVEKYLKRCLDSVINQTLKDIEILCINDGSTDDSLSILEEYKSKDSRIVVITQENKGLAATRNVGIENANGFTLAGNGNNLANSNISVKEIIIKRIATDESDTIFNYFKNKHKVQY